MEGKRNCMRASMEQSGTATTDTDYIELMPSGSNPMLSQWSLKEELQILITNVIHDAIEIA